MTNYAVFLEGNNFELTHGERKDRFDFFVTVRVESPSEQDAKDHAIYLVRSTSELQEAFQNTSEIEPSIEVKVVHELLPENKMKNTEFIYFQMDDSDI